MVSSTGHYVELFEKKVAKHTGSKYAAYALMELALQIF